MPGLRRRHCSGNAPTTQGNAHKTPAAATAKTPKSGLEITAGIRAVIYRHIRVVCRIAALGYGPNASRPTVFLCSGARGVNVRICRCEHGLGTRVSDMQDRYLTCQCWRSTQVVRSWGSTS